jgi:hypothetical protein
MFNLNTPCDEFCMIIRPVSGVVNRVIYPEQDHHLQLTAGNVNDITVAEQLLEHVDFRRSTILADRAYGKWAFREFIADHDADFCIPPKSNEIDPWYCDWWRYKERHLVRSFAAWLLVMTSLPAASLALSSLFVFVFCLHSFSSYAFRNRPSNHDAYRIRHSAEIYLVLFDRLHLGEICCETI